MAEERPVPHHDPKHHVTPRRTYFVIFFALMILTAITVWVAFIDLGPLSTPIAMGIAITKASLVLLYFMHLRHSTRVTWVVLVASFLWLGVLFVLTLSDYLSRRWDPSYIPPFAEAQAETRHEAPATPSKATAQPRLVQISPNEVHGDARHTSVRRE